MIIVSDTSPISGLFVIDKLDILEKLFGKIIIPQAVMNELLELEKRGIDLDKIKTASWIEIKPVHEQNEVELLLEEVDLGEAEAIVLARHMKADWLLIDETKGRNLAKAEGINVLGLLGALLKAKENGIITSVKELADLLVTKAKFRITPDLYQMLLNLSNEK